MAATTPIKPFSPEETRRILDHLQQPAIFLNMTRGWPGLRWTAQHLSACLGDKVIRFRLGRKKERNTPLFETQCSYVDATMAQFLSWTQGYTGASDGGNLSEYSPSEYWAYADYKYIAMLFHDQPSMFQDVKWCDFGFEGRSGRESTLWVGTEGANTPCHLDSYGCNLVLQVQGRKRWHLFPPEDTDNLYPTRIPFEESSVFSQVDILHPDLSRFPKFPHAKVHVVTLQPGQVLYIPRHWWHYVESVDPVTVSINSWMELEVDDVVRVSEAVTKTLVCAVKRDDDTADWLNPTEEGQASHQENMHFLNLAVRACAKRRRGQEKGEERHVGAIKRDSNGQFRNPVAFSVPYGPDLIPVPQAELKTTTQRDSEVRSAVRSLTSQEVASFSTSAHKLQPGKRSPKSQLGAQERPECSPGSSNEELVHRTITTNDLLDCLLHPDIMSRVTELLLERQPENSHTQPLS